MANVQIPNLAAAISIGGPELLEVVQNGVSVRATAQQLAIYTSAQVTIGVSNVFGGVAGSVLYTGSDGKVHQYTMAQLMAALLAAMPTSNPHVVGAWWLNGESVSVSQG